MSLVEMQSALARLYVDGALLERFCVNPAAVLAQYDLTPREAAAVAAIDRAAIRKFAGSLRMKTWGRFKQPYRFVHMLDEAVIRKHYHRFYELRPIQPNEAFYSPILEFGQFLERSFCGNPEVPCYASELARYERRFFLARFEPRRVPARPAGPPPLLVLTPQSRVTVAHGVRVVRFEYDMAALEKAMTAGVVPPTAERTDCAVVLHSLEPPGRARKFHVSTSTADLLALCDGQRSLARIAAALEAEPADVVEAAQGLLTRRLVEEAGLP